MHVDKRVDASLPLTALSPRRRGKQRDQRHGASQWGRQGDGPGKRAGGGGTNNSTNMLPGISHK